MIESFEKWFLRAKKLISKKGIKIEEIEHVANSPLPSIRTIFCYGHYMGEIVVYKNGLIDVDIINDETFMKAKKVDFFEHYELEHEPDWNAITDNFFRFMLHA